MLRGCSSPRAGPCIIHQLSKLQLNPSWWLWEGVRLGRERGGNKEPCEFFAPIGSQLAMLPLVPWLFSSSLMLDPDYTSRHLFPFPKEGPIGRLQAAPHTRPLLPFYLRCVFPLFHILWESSIQQTSEIVNRKPALGWFGVSSFAPGARGWRCSCMARTKTASPPPSRAGGSSLMELAALMGWGREGFKGAHPKATSAAYV